MYFKIKGAHNKQSEPDWTNAKIYMVVSKSDIPPYYGYTTQPLEDRMMDHIHNVESGKQDGCSQHIETGTAIIDLVEKYPCSTRDEIVKRLKWYLKSYVNCNKTKYR